MCPRGMKFCMLVHFGNLMCYNSENLTFDLYKGFVIILYWKYFHNYLPLETWSLACSDVFLGIGCVTVQHYLTVTLTHIVETILFDLILFLSYSFFDIDIVIILIIAHTLIIAHPLLLGRKMDNFSPKMAKHWASYNRPPPLKIPDIGHFKSLLMPRFEIVWT